MKTHTFKTLVFKEGENKGRFAYLHLPSGNIWKTDEPYLFNNYETIQRLEEKPRKKISDRVELKTVEVIIK